MTTQLTPLQVEAALSRFPQWKFDGQRGGLIRREYQLKDFAQAFGFMSHLAIFAEKADHHPEWFNVHRRVDISLTTHDVGGVSEKDLAFAKEADALFAALSAMEVE